MQHISKQEITGIILAGGRGERMGGMDKGLLSLQGKPLVLHVAERLCRQTASIILNCNRNQQDYQALGLTTISDQTPEFLGPAAGLAAALKATHTPYALVVSVDTPFIPLDLAQHLSGAITQKTPIAIVDDGQQMQYLTALVNTSILPQLEKALAAGNLAMKRIQREIGVSAVQYCPTPESYMNINTPEDLAVANEIAHRNNGILF